MKGFVKNQYNHDEKHLEKLLKSDDPNDREILNLTVVNILETDDSVALKFLISKKEIDFLSKQYDGKTPLSVAVSAVSIKTVKLLLNQMGFVQVVIYNHGDLLCLDFPKILPTLCLVEDLMKIINLLSEKEILISVENKLAIAEFLVHNINDCDCGTSDGNDYNLKKKLSNLITHGSGIHVKNIVNNIQEQMDANRILLLDEELIDYIGRPLSPAHMLDLYMDDDILKTVTNVESTWQRYFPLKIQHGEEILKMRAHKLFDSQLTMHQLLNMNPRDSYDYINSLNFHELSKTYTCAGDYMQGLKAKSLVRHQVKEFLPDFMSALFPPLLLICFNDVLPYLIELDNEDILNIGRAAFA